MVTDMKDTSKVDQMEKDRREMRQFFESLQGALNKGESIVSHFAERLDQPDLLIDLLRNYDIVVLDIKTYKNRFLTKMAFHSAEDYCTYWIRTLQQEDGKLLIYAICDHAPDVDILDFDDNWRVGTSDDLTLAFRDPVTLERLPFPFEFLLC